MSRTSGGVFISRRIDGENTMPTTDKRMPPMHAQGDGRMNCYLISSRLVILGNNNAVFDSNSHEHSNNQVDKRRAGPDCR